MGIVVGFLFVTAQVSKNKAWFSGPLAGSFLGRNGLAWLISLLLGGILYAILHLLSKDSAAVRSNGQ